MKNHFNSILLFIILFSSTFLQGISQDQNVTRLFYETLTAEDSTSNKYWDDPGTRQHYADSAFKLLNRYPKDKYSAFLLRYYMYNERFRVYTQEHYDSMISLTEQHIPNFPPGSHSYNQLASLFMTLGIYCNSGAEFKKKKEMELQGIKYAKLTAQWAEKEGDRKMKLYAVYKLFSLYNNLGYTLYASTHHLDPIEKRNMVGPLIEEYYLKSDSCYNVFIEGGGTELNSDPCYRVEVTPKMNLAVLYGHYYYNELKSKLYFKLVEDILRQCPSEHAQATMLHSKGWIAFSWKNYDTAIPYFKESLQRFEQPQAQRLIMDAQFALTMSYFETKEYDSTLVYGSLLLKDTTKYLEPVFISMACSAMSEVYLERNDIEMTKTLLHLSKHYLAKSQHTQVVDEFIKEGETIMVNQIVERISNLTKDLDQAERNSERLKLLFWIALAGVSIIAVGFFVYRLKTLNTFQRQA